MKEKRSFTQKLSMTFGAIVMSPMFFSSPQSQEELKTGKTSFWKTLGKVLKEIWS